MNTIYSLCINMSSKGFYRLQNNRQLTLSENLPFPSFNKISHYAYLLLSDTLSDNISQKYSFNWYMTVRDLYLCYVNVIFKLA